MGVRRYCFYHAGCPDGFGAAWALWRAWGNDGRFIPRGHDDLLDPEEHEGDYVVFADIAPPNEAMRGLAELAGQLTVLDHHVSSQSRYESEPSLGRLVDDLGHHVLFDLGHSGAVLAWEHFHPDAPTPEILRYVEDQDLWHWKLPFSREVNAAISSHPLNFDVWDQIADTPVEQLAEEGTPLVRAQRVEVERALRHAHPLSIGRHRIEAVNAITQRSHIGHELATRARYQNPCGAVYRVTGDRIDVSIYSIGDFDVATLAAERGGGGHRNAAGFSLTLEDWVRNYL